jgi:3-phytase
MTITFTFTETDGTLANQPPVVSISSPTHNSSFVLGQLVVIEATASDSDGTIVKVDFFANNNKIGEDTTSPYSFTWTPPNTGTYNLTARATDNAGATTTSASVSINVTTGTTVIAPLFITEPVKYDSDDPAIWINKDDPTASLIIGTDKESDGALYVFDMEGRIVQDKVIRNLNRPNNVDVAYGIALQGRQIDIAVTTERYAGKLRIYSLPDMLPVDNGGIAVFEGETGTGYREPMGISLYKSPSTNKVYAIVSRKSGPTDGTFLWQYLLEDDGLGNIKGTLVRKFGKFSNLQEIESVAVDNELGYVYYSDERVGVRKYFADPEKGNQELALFATSGFVSDQEGISIYKIGDGTGYILVSDQFADEFHIYTREGSANSPHDHQLVKVVKTSAHLSDGSEVANFPIIPHFPNGVFVAMSDNKTFHLYRWEDIAGSDLRIQPPQLTQTSTQSLIKGGLQLVENQEDQSFEVYPTLAKRGTTISIRTSSQDNVEAVVSDVTGRILYTSKFTGASSIETTNLPSGIYFVSSQGKQQLKKQKFILVD